MRKKNFLINIAGHEINLEVDVTFEGAIMVPLFIDPKINEAASRITFTPDESTFLEDIHNLKPKVMDGNVVNHLSDSLSMTVDKHIATFGRILDTDLYTLISEQVLLVSAINIYIYDQDLPMDSKYSMFQYWFELVAPKQRK